MKKNTKIVSWLILISMLFSVIALFPVHADDTSPAADAQSLSEAGGKQKVVAVVYDNSYSMKSTMTTDKNDGMRATASKYALQMLISLLDEKDQMFIIPMNDGSAKSSPFYTDKNDKISVAFTDSNGNSIKRATVIDTVLNDPKLKIPNSAYAATPAEAIGIALDIMQSKEYGLTKNGVENSNNKEYWLVILNDGDFSEFYLDANKKDNSGQKFSSYDSDSNPIYSSVRNDEQKLKAAKQKQKIKCYIENYTDTLHTVYTSFGSASSVDSDKSMNLDTFNTPNQSKPEVLAKNVQDVANLISGRYTLENTQSNTTYTVSGNKVTVDLSNFEFSLSSLSVTAQDCGATNVSVTYNGSPLKKVESAVLKTKFNLESNLPGSVDTINLKSGFSCQAYPNDQYFSGGTVVFEFSDAVNTNMVSVFAEPALTMTFDILDADGNVTTSANFQDGDKIKVRYKIINPVTKEPVDLGKIFNQSPVKATVNYNNEIYSVNDDKTSNSISLVTGKGTLALTVSANNGKYVLRDSKSILVSKKGFHVEPSGDTTFNNTKDTTATFKVFAENAVVSKSVLESQYTLEVQAKTDTDQTLNTSYIINGDGTVSVTVKTSSIGNDVEKITVYFKATSPEGAEQSGTHDISYKEPELSITADGDKQFKEVSNSATASVKFTVNGLDSSTLDKYTASAKLVAKADKNFSKELKLNKSGNVFSADLEIDLDIFDVYVAQFTITSPRGNESVQTIDVAYVPPFLNVTPSDPLNITQYNLKQNQKAFTFTLTTGKDGNERGFPFENDFTTYVLKIGEKTITGTANGNTLTFIPTADILGSEFVNNPGKYEISLTIKGNTGYSHLDTACETRLEITKTTFEVVAMGDKDKYSSIDRFDLKNTDAVIYFAVLRDGVAISQAELESAYNSGELKIDHDSMLTSFFLPCDLEIKPVMYKETPVIAVRLTDDMPIYFDWHYSAFITGGEKYVTASYKNTAQKTEYFVMADSDIGQHILRISLLIFVHLLIFYIITYIVGFFTTKRLPTGVFTVVRAAGSSSNTVVNMTPWKKYGWHLFRFLIPWRVLSSQSVKKQVPNCKNLEFKNKQGKIYATVQKSDGIFNVKVIDGMPADLMAIYNASVTGGNYHTNLKNLIKKDAPGTKGSELFEQFGSPFVKDTEINMSSGSCYGYYRTTTNGEEFAYAVRFIKINNKKKK